MGVVRTRRCTLKIKCIVKSVILIVTNTRAGTELLISKKVWIYTRRCKSINVTTVLNVLQSMCSWCLVIRFVHTTRELHIISMYFYICIKKNVSVLQMGVEFPTSGHRSCVHLPVGTTGVDAFRVIRIKTEQMQ